MSFGLPDGALEPKKHAWRKCAAIGACAVHTLLRRSRGDRHLAWEKFPQLFTTVKNWLHTLKLQTILLSLAG